MTLRNFYSEEQRRENSIIELARFSECPKCKGKQFSFAITMDAKDPQPNESVNVSLVVECTSCGRVSSAVPVVKDGTRFYLYAESIKNLQLLLYSPFSKAIQNEKRKISSAPRYLTKRPGAPRATSYLQTKNKRSK